MTERKLDMRYARDRQIAATRKLRQSPDEVAPIVYRADLLRVAKGKCYGTGFRDLAGYTGLSVNTIREAFDGNATKIGPLYRLAKWFDIPWVLMFDVDRIFKTEWRHKKTRTHDDGSIDLGGHDQLLIVGVKNELIIGDFK